MAVQTIHIFDRKGKTLFTKRYFPSSGSTSTSDQNIDSEQLSEQRKLVFGMVYSLREITKLLAPPPSAMNHNNNNNTTTTTDTGLHSVRTGASTLHTYETSSGLRLCIYTTNNQPLTPGHLESSSANDKVMTTTSIPPVVSGKVVRAALHYMYHELWIQCVTRSPLYTRTSIFAVQSRTFCAVTLLMSPCFLDRCSDGTQCHGYEFRIHSGYVFEITIVVCVTMIHVTECGGTRFDHELLTRN